MQTNISDIKVVLLPDAQNRTVLYGGAFAHCYIGGPVNIALTDTESAQLQELIGQIQTRITKLRESAAVTESEP